MLLVVVDSPGYGGDVRMPSNVSAYSTVLRVAVEDARLTRLVAQLRERLDACERVERVAAEEAGRGLDRAADAPVLVAPVLARLGRSRRLEVEVGRAARRAGSPREDDAEQVGWCS